METDPDSPLIRNYEGQLGQTLAGVFAENLPSREKLDWLLQDLPTPIATEANGEVLSLGTFPDTLHPEVQALLAYGLPRLFSHYDLVVWDGEWDALAPVMAALQPIPILVVTPEDDAYCANHPLEEAMLLLSKAQASEPVPPSALEAIQSGKWRFLGKLPPLTDEEAYSTDWPDPFVDCFRKLEIPLSFHR